ncbi:hypothetical protein MAP00_005367 [Monascus purpureus]|nr:hypothetical protein MAP00_005367 [Monascus purpureus]
MTEPANALELSLTDAEKRALERAKWRTASGSAYMIEHGTRTSTIGNVLWTNPVALMACLRRVGEKFLGWVDEPLPPDTIRESVTLYWLTEILLRSIYSYREL